MTFNIFSCLLGKDKFVRNYPFNPKVSGTFNLQPIFQFCYLFRLNTFSFANSFFSELVRVNRFCSLQSFFNVNECLNSSMTLHSFSISFQCKNIRWTVGIARRYVWVRVRQSVETLPDFPCSIMCSLRCYSNHTVSKQKALSTHLLLLRFLDVLSICVVRSSKSKGLLKTYHCEFATGNGMT